MVTGKFDRHSVFQLLISPLKTFDKSLRLIESRGNFREITKAMASSAKMVESTCLCRLSNISNSSRLILRDELAMSLVLLISEAIPKPEPSGYRN